MPDVVALRLLRDTQTLLVTFDDGTEGCLSAEYLRIDSPSAEIQGHTPAQKRIVPGKRHVMIEAIEPVGHYAVRLRFSDGHDTGLYSWDWLHRLVQEQEPRWAGYLNELEARGYNRG